MNRFVLALALSLGMLTAVAAPKAAAGGFYFKAYGGIEICCPGNHGGWAPMYLPQAPAPAFGGYGYGAPAYGAPAYGYPAPDYGYGGYGHAYGY